MLVCDCRRGRSSYPDFAKELEFQRSLVMRINQVYSSLCSLGNKLEAQMQIPDSSVHVCGRNFFRDSQVSNDHYLGSFAPLSVIESPQTLNSLRLPGLLGSSTTTASMHDNTSQLLLPDIRLPVPRTEAATECVRKRKIEMIIDEKDQMGYRTEWEQPNKKKAICNTEDPRLCQSYQEEMSDTRETRGSIKRSQKIGDKITALQKLVSPFGKTNTASVLHEATVYIKYLQEQIQMLSIPYFSMRPLHPQGAGGSNGGLRSRGLCLVPVSFTQNLTNKDATYQFISRTTVSSHKP